jgi:hypothetical protein
MLITFNDEALNKQKEYRTSPVKSLKTLSDYGLDVGWYGGKARNIAELKEEPLLLIIDSDLNTLDVAVEESRMKELPIQLKNKLKQKGKYKNSSGE